MDFADVLRRRKAVRSYLDEPIPRETLEGSSTRGRKIPSAGHSQGLRLVVVTDEATKQAIADLAGERHYVELGHEPWISKAAAHVVVGVREDDYHDAIARRTSSRATARRSSGPFPYWYVDAGAAVMLIWLAAIDEGPCRGHLRRARVERRARPPGDPGRRDAGRHPHARQASAPRPHRARRSEAGSRWTRSCTGSAGAESARRAARGRPHREDVQPVPRIEPPARPPRDLPRASQDAPFCSSAKRPATAAHACRACRSRPNAS